MRSDTRGKSVAGICAAAPFLLLCFAAPLYGGVITALPQGAAASPPREVALTFDACETATPSYFDNTILDFLLTERIPFTLFVSGKFALRNLARLSELAAHDFVEIENHSYHHILHMERLPDETVRAEVSGDDDIIRSITGKGRSISASPGGTMTRECCGWWRGCTTGLYTGRSPAAIRTAA
jgi:peptidoglycan/xylan/chitin deacetylase (PgdA/CDA1 family)